MLLTGLALLLTAYAYLQTRAGLARQYSVPLQPIELQEGSQVVAEGERQARIRGCFWCHGDKLQGRKYFVNPNRGVIYYSPNLTERVRTYTPSEFSRAVRHGIRADGTSVQPAMPSFALYNMSDADMAAIISYISSQPPVEGFAGEFRLLPVGWFRWVAGAFSPVAAELIDHSAERPDPAVNGSAEDRGRYLVVSVCEGCHSDNGRLHFPMSPDLAVSLAYDRDELVRLLRTGESVSGRELNYDMAGAARERFRYFSDAEIDAIYAYLRARYAPSGSPEP